MHVRVFRSRVNMLSCRTEKINLCICINDSEVDIYDLHFNGLSFLHTYSDFLVTFLALQQRGKKRRVKRAEKGEGVLRKTVTSNAHSPRHQHLQARIKIDHKEIKIGQFIKALSPTYRSAPSVGLGTAAACSVNTISMWQGLLW